MDYSVIQVLVEERLADEIEKNKFAEIAFRRSDAKFREFIKGRILEGDLADDEIKKKIAKASNELLLPQLDSNHNVRQSVKNIERTAGGIKNTLEGISNSTKRMSYQIDGMFNSLQTVKAVSFLNTGISLANLAVDVVGFEIVCQKLDFVSVQVHSIADSVKKIEARQKNSLIAKYEGIMEDFRNLLAKIDDSEDLTDEECKSLLKDMKVFANELRRDVSERSMDENLAFQMIYAMIPCYEVVLEAYSRQYYFANGKKLTRLQQYLDWFDQFNDQEFKRLLSDYLFLKKNVHHADIMAALDENTLFLLNCRLRVEDELKMLEVLKTKEAYEAFNCELDECIKSDVEQRIPQIAQKAGLDEALCQDIFMRAFEPTALQ